MTSPASRSAAVKPVLESEGEGVEVQRVTADECLYETAEGWGVFSGRISSSSHSCEGPGRPESASGGETGEPSRSMFMHISHAFN